MAAEGALGDLLTRRRANAVLAWALVGFVALVVVESALGGDHVWAGVAALVVALAVVPPAASRDASVMLPWEVVALAALPVLGRATATWWLTSELATHLSVAAIALVVAVELDVLTAVRMPPWFAVLFVVIATMAAAGALAVLRWLSDIYLGTGFVLGGDEATVHTAVMVDFLAATVAGIAAGVVFEWYFRRRIDSHRVGTP